MRLGVKARWNDAKTMAELGADLMEIHIHEVDLNQYYKEMVETFSNISKERDIELVVHNQEYWVDGKNYHLVDLTSQNDYLRKSAVKIVKKTLDFARQVNAIYVIVHPGGITSRRIERKDALSRLEKSLKEIGDSRIILENMPWFYIMRQGEIWRSNICIEAEDLFFFSDMVGGVTLDICHAYLSTREGNQEQIHKMTKSLKDMIKHVHVSDAKPPHHEGLQIGSGFVDFTILNDFNVGIIPEIIDGHKNNGEGFRIAIERLRKLG
ncbi:MAG: sugar phosphate isomerase/epimerase [Thermoplasmata archaeon]|nr:MAG: sugar phosphate isomerase/epimerase [Thermoplasmata archaeon]